MRARRRTARPRLSQRGRFTPASSFKPVRADGGSFESARSVRSSVRALTARQPHLPPGWNTRITYYVAIHAGSGQGGAVSAGCLHATEADVRYLMRAVPLGTPVQISP